MDLVNEELLMKLNKDFENAEELLQVIDPKETPFESKYKARTILKEIIEKLNDLSDTRSHCQALIGGIFCQIGTIDVDVEEFSEAETNLKKSLEHLEQVSSISKEFAVLSLLRALNQLGILWCVRDDYQEAKTYLDKSLEEYNIFSSNHQDHLYELSDLFKASKDILKPNFSDKESVLELINTHS